MHLIITSWRVATWWLFPEQRFVLGWLIRKCHNQHFIWFHMFNFIYEKLGNVLHDLELKIYRRRDSEIQRLYYSYLQSSRDNVNISYVSSLRYLIIVYICMACICILCTFLSIQLSVIYLSIIYMNIWYMYISYTYEIYLSICPRPSVFLFVDGEITW